MTSSAFRALRLCTRDIAPISYGTQDWAASSRPVLSVVDATLSHDLAPDLSMIPVAADDLDAAFSAYEPSAVLLGASRSMGCSGWYNRQLRGEGPEPHIGTLLRRARSAGIPVLSWLHDETTAGEQARTARSVDRVFATTGEMAHLLATRGVRRVKVLPLAVQTRVYRPFSEGPRAPLMAVFSGSSPQLSQLPPSIAGRVRRVLEARGYRLLPPAPRPGGRLPLPPSPSALHSTLSDITLAVDLTTDASPLLPKLCASGTGVIALRRRGDQFGNLAKDLLLIESEEELPEAIEELLSQGPHGVARHVHRGWRTAVVNHSYAQRASELRVAAGIPEPAGPRPFLAVIEIRSTAARELDTLMREIRALRSPLIESVIALTDPTVRAEVSDALVREGVAQHSAAAVLRLSHSHPLLGIRPEAQFTETAVQDLHRAAHAHGGDGIVAKTPLNGITPIAFERAPMTSALLWASAAGADVSTILQPGPGPGSVDHLDPFNLLHRHLTVPSGTDWRN